MNLIIFVVATVLAINANAANVFFSVNQGVSGVTDDDFNANKASFTETVQLAVAETLSGVTTSATVTGVNFVNQVAITAVQPTFQPSSQPSAIPSSQPSTQPSSEPSSEPTVAPSTQPSAQPSTQPSAHPSSQPSAQPTVSPTSQPSSQPSVIPSSQPSSQPTTSPSMQPSAQPSSLPSAQPTSGGDDGVDDGGNIDDQVFIYRRLASTLTMQYIVQILDTSNATTVFTNVLQTAADDGTLESNLHSAALTTGADLMSNIAVESNAFEVSDLMTKRGDSKRLTGAQITGLIIGVFMFLGVLGTLIAFIMSCSAAAPATSAAADKSLELA